MRARAWWTGVGALALMALLALAAVTGAAPAQQQVAAEHALSFEWGVVDVRRQPSAGVELVAAAAADPAASAVFLVKFAGPVSAREQQELAAAGGRVYAYVPHYAYVARLPLAAVAARSAGLARASWIGPYLPEYKLSRAVRDAGEGGGAEGGAAASERRPVSVHVFPDADLDDLVARIPSLAGLGAESVAGAARNPFFSRLRLLLTPAELAAARGELAAMPEVFWIDGEPRKSLLNNTTVWVCQSGTAGGMATPVFAHGIFGQGQVVGIIDTGLDADMCYFSHPAQGLPTINACNGGTAINAAHRKVLAVNFLWQTECNGGISGSEWDTHDHGSHVAGTVAGDNLANGTHDGNDGMAPAAKLVIQDGGFQTDNCGDLPGIGCPVVDLNPLFQQTYDQGARLHTNSWGDNENDPTQNDYSLGSQDVDEFMWNHKDFLVFFAAGNSGPGTASVGTPSTAKSAVSVGSTLHDSNAESMSSFSSCGPTDDGRRKPEVTVPGSSVISANNDLDVTSANCGTRSMSGTSMASPGAAGLGALVRQYYVDGWYPTGAAIPVNGFTPSAALLRATMVNSAQQMSGVGFIPGNCQGWGRVTLDNALHWTGEARKLWLDDDDPGFTAAGDERTYQLTVAAGTPLKLTLGWTDFPSTPATLPHLNNDLDLEVCGPGGFFRGNVFMSGQSTTGGTADRFNTLEQVLIGAPAAGIYTVRVRSFNVPNGPQPFAVVATGDLAPVDTHLFRDGFESGSLCAWSSTGTAP